MGGCTAELNGFPVSDGNPRTMMSGLKIRAKKCQLGNSVKKTSR